MWKEIIQLFRAYEARNLNMFLNLNIINIIILNLNIKNEQLIQMGEIDERMRQWASNWIYLSQVSSNIKEKQWHLFTSDTKATVAHHPPHREYLHPKKIYQNHPHGEDLSYRQFCLWFQSAVHMIIGNFEISRE